MTKFHALGRGNWKTCGQSSNHIVCTRCSNRVWRLPEIAFSVLPKCPVEPSHWLLSLFVSGVYVMCRSLLCSDGILFYCGQWLSKGKPWRTHSDARNVMADNVTCYSCLPFQSWLLRAQYWFHSRVWQITAEVLPVFLVRTFLALVIADFNFVILVKENSWENRIMIMKWCANFCSILDCHLTEQLGPFYEGRGTCDGFVQLAHRKPHPPYCCSGIREAPRRNPL